MEITEVRIKLMEGSEDRLRAFCSITIDQSFVIRDLKIIDGSHGPFVAMPSRKLTGHCTRCGSKNHLRAAYCNHCGAKLQMGSVADTPQKLYADVAHPINSECREMIQNAVVVEFNAELQRAAQPNYRSRYDDEFDAGDYDEADYSDSASPPTTSAAVATRSADPIDAGAREPVKRSSSARESPSRQQPNVTDASALGASTFGAGLFDAEPSAARTELLADDSDANEDASSAESTEAIEARETTESIVVRGESGVQNSLPRPHFRDRASGNMESVAPSNTPSNARHTSNAGADAVAAENTDKKPADDSGFGAGIFDD